MALIERGMMPARNKSNFNILIILFCIFFGIGLGLLFGHFVATYIMSDSPILAQSIFIALFLGGGLVTAYVIHERRHNK